MNLITTHYTNIILLIIKHDVANIITKNHNNTLEINIIFHIRKNIAPIKGLLNFTLANSIINKIAT